MILLQIIGHHLTFSLSLSLPPSQYALIDTPGQIEIFTWSAAGAVITEALASSLPTVILYVVDTPRCESPAAFMSNMLYACSILYKTRLPFVIAFNKTDAADPEPMMEWMQDYQVFLDALDNATTGREADDESYMSTLTRSMALALAEFYETIAAVPVSAVTGDGVDQLLAAIDAGAQEWASEYVPELMRKRAVREATDIAEQNESMQRFRADLAKASLADGQPPPVKTPAQLREEFLEPGQSFQGGNDSEDDVHE